MLFTLLTKLGHTTFSQYRGNIDSTMLFTIEANSLVMLTNTRSTFTLPGELDSCSIDLAACFISISRCVRIFNETVEFECVARNTNAVNFPDGRVLESYSQLDCLTCNDLVENYFRESESTVGAPLVRRNSSRAPRCRYQAFTSSVVKHSDIVSPKFLSPGKRRRSRGTREESGTRREALFPVGGVRIEAQRESAKWPT